MVKKIEFYFNVFTLHCASRTWYTVGCRLTNTNHARCFPRGVYENSLIFFSGNKRAHRAKERSTIDIPNQGSDRLAE